VRNYGKLAWSLTERLRKDNFYWNELLEQAFQSLKKDMTNLPVLALPNFSKEFIVETDASGHGLGAILMQEQRPLAFFSHALNPIGRNKSMYKRELMAIVFTVKKWRHYLLGRKFIIRTDQRTFKFFIEQRLVSLECHKWVVKLMEYDFEIQYSLGLENRATDALSRLHSPITLMALIISRVL